MNWIEIVGYAGSVLVAVSLAMSDVVRLRTLNLLGSSIFTLYGLLVHAYPVAAVNGFIVVVNLVYLWKMLRDREYFEVVAAAGPQSPYLQRFLEYHADEIAEVAPGFDLARLPGASVLFILRNLEPAGLVVWTDQGDGTVRMELDFAVPRYRDLRCGRWFYRDGEANFRAEGFRRFETFTPSPRHGRYLQAVGFEPAAGAAPGWFSRNIDTARPEQGQAA